MSRVAIVRGPHLNKWEMQTYEPLTEFFDITAYTTYNHIFNIEVIKLKKKFFYTPEDIIKFIPTKRLKYYLGNLLVNDVNRDRQYMYGLEREKNQDIFHVCDSYSWAYQCLRIKRKYKKRLVVTAWENLPFRNDPNFSSRFIKEALINEADYFLPVTDASAEVLKKEGVDANRMSVIYPGVNLDKFKPGAKHVDLNVEYGLLKNKTTVLFIGRLVKQKGIYDILTVAENLKNHQFVIAGDGPEKETLLSIKKEKSIHNLFFVPYTPYEKVPSLINLSDILILPSLPTKEWEEQFGMVLIEAMACGKVVLASKTGAIPEVLADSGITFTPGDITEIIDIIKGINENATKKYKTKARLRAEQVFNAEKQSQKIKDVYNSLL